MEILKNPFLRYKWELIIALLALPVISIAFCGISLISGYFTLGYFIKHWQQLFWFTMGTVIVVSCLVMAAGMIVIAGVIIWMIVKSFPHKLLEGGFDWWNESKMTHKIGMLFANIFKKIRKRKE